jgi:hypothetical protein
MDISAALQAVEDGKAVSRRAWGDPDKIMRADTRFEDQGGWGLSDAVAIGPQTFTQADLDANDWFIVAAIN